MMRSGVDRQNMNSLEALRADVLRADVWQEVLALLLALALAYAASWALRRRWLLAGFLVLLSAAGASAQTCGDADGNGHPVQGIHPRRTGLPLPDAPATNQCSPAPARHPP